jgi:hypothetical protein
MSNRLVERDRSFLGLVPALSSGDSRQFGLNVFLTLDNCESDLTVDRQKLHQKQW